MERAPTPVGPTVNGSCPCHLSGAEIPARDHSGRLHGAGTCGNKDEATKIIEAAGDDLELKFALYCGFDAGLRRNEISEAKVTLSQLLAESELLKSPSDHALQ
jgi:hypothetical protein